VKLPVLSDSFLFQNLSRQKLKVGEISFVFTAAKVNESGKDSVN